MNYFAQSTTNPNPCQKESGPMLDWSKGECMQVSIHNIINGTKAPVRPVSLNWIPGQMLIQSGVTQDERIFVYPNHQYHRNHHIGPRGIVPCSKSSCFVYGPQWNRKQNKILTYLYPSDVENYKNISIKRNSSTSNEMRFMVLKTFSFSTVNDILLELQNLLSNE